ncbi:MAG: ribonuclease E activity regulator RraA [Gemmatimonadales bacterium]
MTFATADLCDAFGPLARLAAPIFRDYGGLVRFAGPIDTVQVSEDNALVAQVLDTPGLGRVLVVDGGGSLRCALVGGRLAALAHSNGWAGLLINGCVRDLAEIRGIPVGVRAINSSPRRGGKTGSGKRGGTVTFADVTFSPGDFLYADEDGVVLADRSLTQ